MAKLSREIVKYSEGEKIPGFSSIEFVTKLIDFCRKNKLKVYTVNSPSKTQSVGKDGSVTEVTPPVTITPLGKSDSVDGRSLFVTGNGINFTIWYGEHEANPDELDAYVYQDEGLTKVDYTQVHVYEKDLPKKLKPKDLQKLRSVSGNVAHMQYIRQVGKINGDKRILLDDRLDVFAHGSEEVVEFYNRFVASLDKKK